MVFAAAPVPILAQTWSGPGYLWSQPASWGGTLPANDGTADLIFSGGASSGSSMLDTSWNAHSITWNVNSLGSGSATVNQTSQAALTLRAGFTNASGGSVTLYPDVVLSAFQTWNDTSTTSSPNAGPGTTVNGTISGAGGIRKTGSGILRLRADSNSFTGGLELAGGMVEAGSSAALGAASNPLTFTGGTLRFATFALMKSSVTLAQPVTLGTGGGTIVTRYGTTTLSGGIGGSGELRFEADPTWGGFLQSSYVMTGANSYSGGTVLGAVSVNATGTGQALGTGGITLKEGAVLSIESAANLGGGKVALQPASVLVLKSTAISPASVIDSGSARTTGGTLAYTTDVTSPVNMAAIGNGKLFLGSAASVTYSATSFSAGTDGVYRVGGGAAADSSDVPAPTLTFSGTTNLFTGARSVIVGAPQPAVRSEAYRGVNVFLKQANDYTGGTTLAAGILSLGNDNALGSGTLTITGGSGTQLNADGGSRQVANPVVFQQPVGANFTIGATNFTSTFTFNGPVDLGGAAHVFFSQNGRTSFLQPISNGGLTLETGNWTLAAANTLTGGLTIADSGILDVSSDAQLGGTGNILSIIGGVLHPTASFTIAHPIALSAYGSTFTVDSQTLTIAGSVSGNQAIVKNGTGTLIFTGTDKAISSLTVNAGLVRIVDMDPEPTTSVVLKSGATFGGKGTIGSIQASSGGRIAPGSDTPGTLTFQGSMTLDAGVALAFDLGPTEFDRIILGLGSLTKHTTGTIGLSLANAGGLAVGQTYTLIDWSAGSSILQASDFSVSAGLIKGSLSVVNQSLRITISAVPEPANLLLLGVLALGFTHRRKSRPS